MTRDSSQRVALTARYRSAGIPTMPIARTPSASVRMPASVGANRAMNEARIENYLAKKVVDNPNELSGARPAPVGTAANSTNTSANTNVTAGNLSSNSASSTVINRPAVNQNAKPATTPAAKPVTNATANVNKSK